MNSIHDICKQYGIENYTVNPDGSIDVNGNVSLSWLSITELPLRFNKVNGYFDCSNNKLTSLKGSPKRVDRYFDCSYNQLSSLEFSPDYVGKYFNCDDNKLTDNLCDTEIGGGFYTTLKQDGLMSSGYGIPTNYNEWRKLYKRKMILDDIFNM